MKKSIQIGWFAALLALMLSRCGAPLGPAENKWQKKGEIPEPVPTNIADMVVTPDGVYISITRSRPLTRELAIIVFKDGRFEDDWVYPNAGPFAKMGGIEKAGTALWAAGTTVSFVGIAVEGDEPYRYKPILIRNTGLGWNEVDLGVNVGFGGIGRIYPISEDACWLLTGDSDPGSWYGSLVKYDNGVCTPFPGFSQVTAAYGAASNTFYVIHRKKGNVVEVAITTDEGASWTNEKATLGILPSGDVSFGEILPPVVYDGDLFFVVNPDVGGRTWTAIYRRTGAPGRGEYEMAFYSNFGPYFRTVEHLAADKSPRFMGVDTDTCLIFDGNEWLLEMLPYPHTGFNGLAAAETGFYATANNETTGKLELLYHP